MDDYDNGFEIEEEVEGEDQAKNDPKKKSTAEKPTIRSLSRNNSREIPLSTRKVQPLGNHNSNNSGGFQNNYTPSTQTYQSQDYSSKPKLKPFDLKGSDSKTHNDSNSFSELKKQESADALISKPFSKPFKIQKRYDDDSNTSNTLDEDTKYHIPKPVSTKKHKYNFEDDSFSQPRTSVSKPPRLPQTNYASIQLEIPNNYEEVMNLINSFPSEKNERELEEENKQLRKKLKEMNNLITNIIARQDLSKLVPKKLTFKEKSAEDRLRTYNHEIQNNKKILAIRQDEYQKLKERTDKIKDPALLLKIEEKTKKTLEKIEQIRKENKQLELQSQNSGKNLSNIENDAGLPEALVIANERAREAAVLEKKNEKLKETTENFEKQQEQQHERLDQLNYKIQKLEELAKHHNISLEKNPHKQKYEDVSKEVKEYEEGIKILLNRNDKYMENFFEHGLEEQRSSNERDKAHLATLDEMIQKQVTTLKDMLAKESTGGDRGMQELFNKLQGSLDEKKPGQADEEKTNAEKKVTKKPPLHKQPNEREEMYKDLPLFSPKRDNTKKANKKGVRSYSTGKRSPSPEDREKMMDEINELYKKQEKEQKEKKEKGDETKNQEKPKKPNFKKAYGEEPKKEEVEKKVEEKVVEKVEPEQTKPEAVEEKKPFSKPFGFKKGGGSKINNYSAANDSAAESEKKEEPQPVEKKLATDYSKPLVLEKKEDSLGNKFKDTPDMNYIAGGSSRLNNQNNQLKMPDFDGGKKKEEPPANTGSKFAYGNGGGGLTLGGGQSQVQEQKQPKEELPAEDLGIGASRMNRNRMMKKDENKEELVLNFGGSAKNQNSQVTAGGRGLKLADSLNADKKDNQIFTLTQKTPAENEIKDPFAKYDDVSNLDFTKKKIGLEGGGIKKIEDDSSKLLFGEKKSEFLFEKKEDPKPFTLEKKEDPKPFTLDNKQAGPKRIFGPDSSSQQNQPFSLGSQPFSLGQNKQPQLRFGGDQGGSALNDKEIKMIGDEKKDEGLKLGNSGNTGSIWDKKEKDSDIGGGFKLGGGDKKDSGIGGVLKFDEENNKGLKFGGGGASIWDKKEQSSGTKEIGQDQPKDTFTLNFGEKKKTETEGALSFLNEKPANAEKKENDLNIGDETKKPRRLKMGDKTEPKKNTLGDGTHGNDFFDDLDI